MKFYPEKLGDFIAKEREKRNYSSRAIFAKKIGMNPSTIGYIETGETSKPGLDSILVIANGLKVDPMKLIAVYQGKDPDDYENVNTDSNSKLILDEIINVLLKNLNHRLFAEALLAQDGPEKVLEYIAEAKRRRAEKKNGES